jgi:hypothetical protein
VSLKDQITRKFLEERTAILWNVNADEANSWEMLSQDERENLIEAQMKTLEEDQ